MPSRKVISLFIVCVALVVSIIIASGIKSPSTIALNTGLLSKGPEINLPQNTNWEGDVSALSLAEVNVSEIQKSSTGNTTDAIAESLMSNYLALRQNGELNNGSVQKLIDQASDFSDDTGATKKTYSSKDIVVSVDNSKEATKEYGTALGNILKINNSSQKGRAELQAFRELTSTKDISKGKELKIIGEDYKKIAQSFAKIKVPSSYVESHLIFINSIEGLGGAVNDMAKVLEDPIKGLSGIGIYQSNLSIMLLEMNRIRVKILKDGVVYKQGERGYYLYYGI
ncbi:MAG TPA: hypothetical protein VJH67_02085 [Candidatus Paceibacterota bacterium]